MSSRHSPPVRASRRSHAQVDYEEPGFAVVVDAGIGSKTTDFRAMQVNTFPGARKRCAVWGSMTIDETVDISVAAYGRLAHQGSDVCDLKGLAGTVVGVRFVRAVAVTLMLAQVSDYCQAMMSAPISAST